MKIDNNTAVTLWYVASALCFLADAIFKTTPLRLKLTSLGMFFFVLAFWLASETP